jgi:hypothetical protein
MGYDTDFDGKFLVSPALDGRLRAFLVKFSRTRRVKRDLKTLLPLYDGSNFGPEGAYFVDGIDSDATPFGQPPFGQPNQWCQWIPNEDGTAIIYDGGEKFYNYIEWIAYIIRHFLAPKGYTLNGEVSWRGQDGDTGKITVIDNVVWINKSYFVSDDFLKANNLSIENPQGGGTVIRIIKTTPYVGGGLK